MREREDTRFLGFIMFTSSEREEDVEAAFERGANLYLVKHLDFREVVGVVREIFAQFMAQGTGFGTL
jgi:PleD family two-component response regulator